MHRVRMRLLTQSRIRHCGDKRLDGQVGSPRAMERRRRQVIAAHVVQRDHVERCRRRTLLVKAADMEPSGAGRPWTNLVDARLVAMEGEDDRLVRREQLDESRLVHAVRMDLGGKSAIRSTTFTTRTLSSGAFRRSHHAAAIVSSVGTSPAQASTTSGSTPRRCSAQSQTEAPRAQCSAAASMSSHWSSGCLSITIRFT